MKTETADLLGQQVGSIRVVDVLGEGGMGAVYAGFDDKLQRRVAVKAIHPQFRLQDEAKARFLREARILSQLDHPNICTVYELIEGEDRDFLVLELIKGTSLRQALERGLNEAEKMRIAKLLLEVLVAVHGHGVVHRDLKPENVMVLNEGGIKVLDFGLSRSIDEEGPRASHVLTIQMTDAPERSEVPGTLSRAGDSRSTYVKTRQGTVVGTIGYMSPEQARAEPATSATDMYSLGLILQEMFTGEPPFEPNLDATELLKRASEGRSRPVTGLRRDLTDFIERLKAPAPGARPSSLDALQALQRIIDKPRRRAWRMAVSTVIIVLVLFSVVLSGLLVKLGREVERADREADTAKVVSAFLVELFQVSDPSEARGNSVTAREILDQGATRIDDELADQPLVRARLKHTMGKVYQALGLYGQATELQEDALFLRRENLPAVHDDLVESLSGLAWLLVNKGDYDAAEVLFREALAMDRQLHGAEHESVAMSLNNLALVLSEKGDYDAAEPLQRKALEMHIRLLGEHHEEVATDLNNLAILIFRKGDVEGAARMSREALEKRRRIFGETHPLVAESLTNLAVFLQKNGQLEEAAAMHRESVALKRRLYGGDHPSLALGLNNLGATLRSQGDFEAAETVFREALEMYDRLGIDEHPHVATSLNHLGRVLAATGDYAEAETLLRGSVSMQRELFGERHPLVASSLYNLAAMMLDKGDFEAAEPLFREAMDIAEETLPVDHPNRRRFASGYAEALREAGRDAEAAEVETVNAVLEPPEP